MFFPLGQVLATPGVLRALEKAEQSPMEFLDRHRTGDWGDLDEEDKKTNEEALQRGGRLFSAYGTNAGERIYIITEWNRSVTTLLLPSEY